MPSGIWARQEYAKLPPYDQDTAYQPMSLFFCHQQDGRLCAGWAGCHDMYETLAVRMAASMGSASDDVIEALLDYSTEVPLFGSGAEAAAHGLADIEAPGLEATRQMGRLLHKGVARHDDRPAQEGS